MGRRQQAILCVLIGIGCAAPTGDVGDGDKAAASDFAAEGERFLPTAQDVEEAGDLPIERRVTPVVTAGPFTVSTPNVVFRPNEDRAISIRVSRRDGVDWYAFVLRLRARGSDEAWQEIAPPNEDGELDSYWYSVTLLPHGGMLAGSAIRVDSGLRLTAGVIPGSLPDPVLQTFLHTDTAAFEYQVLAFPLYNPGDFEVSEDQHYDTGLAVRYEGEACGAGSHEDACDLKDELEKHHFGCAPGLHALGIINERVRCVPTCTSTASCSGEEVCTPISNDVRTCAVPGEAMHGESCADVERGERQPSLCGYGLACRRSVGTSDEFESLDWGTKSNHRCWP